MRRRNRHENHVASGVSKHGRRVWTRMIYGEACLGAWPISLFQDNCPASGTNWLASLRHTKRFPAQVSFLHCALPLAFDMFRCTLKAESTGRHRCAHRCIFSRRKDRQLSCCVTYTRLVVQKFNMCFGGLHARFLSTLCISCILPGPEISAYAHVVCCQNTSMFWVQMGIIPFVRPFWRQNYQNLQTWISLSFWEYLCFLFAVRKCVCEETCFFLHIRKLRIGWSSRWMSKPIWRASCGSWRCNT